MTDLIARATREVCGAGGCERTALLQELHARDRIIEDMVQALYALNDELERMRAVVAAADAWREANNLRTFALLGGQVDDLPALHDRVAEAETEFWAALALLGDEAREEAGGE